MLKRQLTLREIANHCDLPVSSCHAVVQTLLQRGYLYTLGGRKELYPNRRLLSLAQAIVPVPDGDFGQVRMQNVVPRFTREPGEVRSTAGQLGANNDEVFGGWLGLTPAQRERLRSSGVI